MSTSISPLAPKTYADLPAIDGVAIATAAAGIKYRGRTDVLMMRFSQGTRVAGVFTTSKCPSAPVDFCRESLKGGRARVLVVNSGNANAFTGQRGRDSVALTARIAAQAAACAETDVFVASTGVIGEPLDASKFEGVLADCAGRAADSPAAWAEAAAAALGCATGEVFLASTGVIGEPLPADKFSHLLAGMAERAEPTLWREAADAIMTTDTYPKVATRTATLDGQTVRINGIAKGAGMIAPNMATMLSFVATDAAIAPDALQVLLARATEPSFNSVTVDSDTSTSDTLLLFATGRAGGAEIEDGADPRLGEFAEALGDLLLDLARQVARDGEGARKEIQVTVEGAVDARSAKRIALSIANSPLVKTAVAGEDANWGRVVMAVGKAGEPADRDRLAIWFGDVRVAVDGERDAAYVEAEASAAMKADEIAIRVDLGLGDGRWTVYSCDLTKEYVAINGDYRS